MVANSLPYAHEDEDACSRSAQSAWVSPRGASQQCKRRGYGRHNCEAVVPPCVEDGRLGRPEREAAANQRCDLLHYVLDPLEKWLVGQRRGQKRP